MKATNTQWDTDAEDRVELPAEIEIPSGIENDVEEISDYLSNVTGYCHKGFVIEA